MKVKKYAFYRCGIQAINHSNFCTFVRYPKNLPPQNRNNMIKKLLILICAIMLSTVAKAQTFSVTYDFANVSTSSGTLDPTPTPTAIGVTFGAFSARGTPANPNAGGRFSFTNWPLGSVNGATSVSSMTGALVPTKYYEVTLSPQAGYTGSLDTIRFTLQRSSTGIRSYAVRASVDGFTNNLPAAVVSGTALSVVTTNEFFVVDDNNTNATNGSAIILSGASSATPVTFRFYGWNAEASGGTFSIDNVKFIGLVSGCSPVYASSATVCVGSSASLTAGGATSYTWNTGDNTASIVVTPSVSTSYTVSGTTTAGCVSTATTEVVVITSTPTITVSSATICSGHSATLTATGASSYTWSNAANTSSIIVAPTTNTSYLVYGELSGCVGTFSNSADVTVNPTPVITPTATTIGFYGVICHFDQYIVSATGASTYSWSTEDSAPSLTLGPTNSAGNYTYEVTGTNSLGCVANAQLTVTVILCTGIAQYTELLTAISPNPAKETIELSFTTGANKNINIINALGEIVYSKNTNEQTVNVNVSTLPKGIYFVTITSNNQKAIKKLIVE